MVDLGHFLKTIFDGKAEDGHILLARQTGIGGGFQHAPWPSTTAERWLKKGSAVYFTVSSVRQGEKNADGSIYWRRRKQDCVEAHVLVLDDVGTKGNPPPVEPSYKLESSTGNFQWGYLIEPFAGLERYAAIVDAVAELGYADKGAGGYNRVMRVPGSVNLKPGKNSFVSKIVDWHPERTWQLEDLAKALGVDTTKLEVRPTRAKPGGAAAADGIVVDPLLVWLADNGYVVKDDGKDWVEVKCPWADQHTTGADTAGYSPLGRGEGEWVDGRGFKCMHQHCRDRHFAEFRDWATSLGAPWTAGKDPLPSLQGRYVFIEDGERIADMLQRPNGGFWILTCSEFDKRHHRRIATPEHKNGIMAKKAFLESPETRKVARLIYDPTQAETAIITVDGQRAVNLYVRPTHPETPADDVPVEFLEHIQFLTPLSGETDLLLNWLACWIQRPDKRLFAIIMVADNAFGIGRSWLADMMGLLEPGQVKKANLGQLIGKGTHAEQNYNDWQTRCRVLIVEEARDIGREDFFIGFERFKQIIDVRTSVVRVNEKYGRTRDEAMYFSCMIFSNHVDAMVLPEGERRVAVITNPTTRRDFGYYERLHDCLTQEYAARVFWWLKRRDISMFDSVFPPMTDGKQLMTEMSVNPIDEIRRALEENLPGDLVTRKSLGRYVRSIASERGLEKIHNAPGPAARRLWNVYGSLRPTDRNGARYLINNATEEVRAIRNKRNWQSVDTARDRKKVASELKKNPPESAELFAAFRDLNLLK